MKAIIKPFIQYLIIAILAVGFVYKCNRAMKEAKDKKRVEAAMTASQTPAKPFTTKDGKQASKVDVQHLTTQEVKHIYPGVINEADNVNIKPGQIQDYSQIGYNLYQDITVPMTSSNRFISLFNSADSAFSAKMKADTGETRYFKYSDYWTNLKGSIKTTSKGDTLKLNLQCVDTITRFIHKGDRVHPWLWIFSKRKTQETIVNSNPHTKIVYQTAIKTL